MGKALIDELSRVYERLRSPSTTMLGQYIAVVLVSGLVAVSRMPEAFAVVPVFWSAWLLHALVLDLDSVKLGVYARWLEQKANEEIGHEVFVWESKFAGRGRIVRPAAYIGSVVYWVLMNMTSWVIAIVILARSERPWLALLLVVTAVGVFGLAAWTMSRRRYYNAEWERVAASIRIEPIQRHIN